MSLSIGLVNTTLVSIIRLTSTMGLQEFSYFDIGDLEMRCCLAASRSLYEAKPESDVILLVFRNVLFLFLSHIYKRPRQHLKT